MQLGLYGERPDVKCGGRSDQNGYGGGDLVRVGRGIKAILYLFSLNCLSVVVLLLSAAILGILYQKFNFKNEIQRCVWRANNK